MKENSIGDRIEEKYTRYLNSKTDTLELTIEEAIFIVETDKEAQYVEVLLQEAYKVILSDYKRVLKENEHKKEKIENQKAELAILNEKQKDLNKLQNTLNSYKGQFIRQEKENEKINSLIKKLQKENEELKKIDKIVENITEKDIEKAIKEYDECEDEFKTKLSLKQFDIKENSIQISKIKDKIEELKNEKEEYYSQYKIDELNDKIQILQELIEEREEK